MKKCKTCKHYDAIEHPINDCGKMIVLKKKRGLCRINPPVAGKIPWVNVSENDWCGYHAEK
jgi:hypothetical protein